MRAYLLSKLSVKAMRIKHALTTFKATSPRHIVCYVKSTKIKKFVESSVLLVQNEMECHKDGVGAMFHLMKDAYCYEFLQFFELATKKFKLSYYHAMGLLEFFTFNASEALQQLCGVRNLLLDVDVPWRLQVKTVSQQPDLKISKIIQFLRIEMMIPHSTLADVWEGRYVRLQRCYYKNSSLLAACLLPDDLNDFQLSGILLPLDKNSLYKWKIYRMLTYELSTFIGLLVLATTKLPIVDHEKYSYRQLQRAFGKRLLIPEKKQPSYLFLISLMTFLRGLSSFSTQTTINLSLRNA